MRQYGPAFSAFIFMVFLAACGAPAPAISQNAPPPPDKPNPTLRTVELVSGSVRIQAEVAAKPEERERGLMFRDRIEDGKGMLFVFEADERLAFWMKNTKIPLSIAYISADGTIREILDLEPGSLDPVRSERSVRYALETPRGWYERVGLKPGDRFEIPALE